MESYKKSLEFDRVLENIARYVKTAPGRELLFSLPDYPGVEAIDYRFELIGQIKDLTSFESKLYFDDLDDHRDGLKRMRIEGYFLEPVALYRLSQALYSLTQLRSTVFRYREKYPAVWNVAKVIPTYQKYYSEINRCLDPSGEVLDGASPKLASIRREISSLAGRVQSKLRDLINKIKAHAKMQEDYVTIREGRFVIPMPVSEQGRVKGIIHDYSQSRSTVFMEPITIMNENNELRELKESEAAEVARIIASLNDMVRPEAAGIISSLEVAYALDRDAAIAAFAAAKNCEKVRVSMDGELEIIKGRHPLLKDGCVPLNLKISKNHDILLLSGPNAGGKTVLLKTIGLFAVMARCGIPLPADPTTTVTFIDKMFVDIGDSQSITENLSTFSGHVRFLSEMIAGIEVPERTMVLLDELGSGSAPNYSSAIACAVIWHLASRRVKSVITTHFSGVVDFAYSLDNAINGSLEFDLKNLRPTYRLVMGVPGASYAIHIARNYGLQKEIVDKAMEFLDKNEIKYEELISELVNYSTDLKSQHQKIASESEKLRLAEKNLLDTEKAFRKTRMEIEEELREEYERKYNELLMKVNSITAAAGDEFKKARKKVADEISGTKREIREPAPAPKPGPSPKHGGERPDAPHAGAFPYSTGEKVLIEKFNSNAIIMDVDMKRRQALVEFGNKMQMWVKFSLISGTPENLAEFEDRGTVIYKKADVSVGLELDIRGKKCEEGIDELDRYLMRASENRFESVRIVHGKGTLALKAAVEAYLKKSHYVKSFRTGKYGEGDYGVTIVELAR